YVLCIAVALQSSFVCLFGPQRRVSALDVLSDHDKRHQQELHDIADEQQEREGIWIKWLTVDQRLPQCPTQHKDSEEKNGPHRSYRTSNYYRDAIEEGKSLSLELIDVSWWGAVPQCRK